MVLSMKIKKNQTWQNGYLTIEEDFENTNYTMQFSAQPGQSYIWDQGGTRWQDATQLMGEKGAFHNVNIHAIMLPKEQELDTAQLQAIEACAKTANETDIAEVAATVLELSKEETMRAAQRQLKFIQGLQAALVRIENKTYGICRETGKLIPAERLRAVPHATLSIEAKNNRK